MNKSLNFELYFNVQQIRQPSTVNIPSLISFKYATMGLTFCYGYGYAIQCKKACSLGFFVLFFFNTYEVTVGSFR